MTEMGKVTQDCLRQKSYFNLLLVQNLKIGDDDFDNDTEEDVGVDTDDTDDSTVENNFDNVKEDDNKADVMKTDSKKPESLLKNNFDTSMEGLLGE